MSRPKLAVSMPLLARALPPLIFALLTLLVFRSVLFPKTFGSGESDIVVSSSMGDVINEFLPMRAFGFNQLRHGNLALWNPHIFGGVPYLAGFQSALLYPPNVLHLLLSPVTAINWLVATHVFIAGWLMHSWMRSRGASAPAGVLAGIIFMFCGPVFLRVYAGHVSHLYVMVWTPMVLLAVDRLASTGQWRWCLPGSSAVAMQILGGSPQFVYYAGLVVGIYAVVLCVRSKFRLRLLGGTAAMFAIASLLTAIQLLPGIQALGESVRSSGTAYEFASSFAMPAENFLTTFMPTLFGNVWHDVPSDSLDYFGRSYLWETSMFIGVGGLMLACFAAFAQPRLKAPLLMMVGVTIVLALGRHLPVYRLLFNHLPLYASFRATSKFVFLTVIFLCPLAADGFDLLADRAHRVAARRAAVASGVVAALLLLFAVAVTQPGVVRSSWMQLVHHVLLSSDNLIPHVPQTEAELQVLTSQNAQQSAMYAAVAAGAAAVLLAFTGRWPVVRYGFVALTTIELVLFAESTFVTTVARRPYPPAWQATLRSAPDNDRVLCYNLPPGADVTYLDWGMVNGARQLWGYDPGVLKRYAETLSVSQGLPPSAASQYLEIRHTTPGLLQMLRCRFGFTFAGDDGVVIPYPNPLDVVQLMSNYRVVPDRGAMLSEVNAPAFNPHQTVLLESEPRLRSLPGAPTGEVKVVARSTDWLEIQVNTDRATLLLITENYSTGWHATPVGVGGPQRAYDVMPADSTLMAIPLASGQHHIRLEYKPTAYIVGRDVSVASLVLYVLLSGAWFYRTRFAVAEV